MDQGSARGLSWSVALRLGRVSNLPTVWSNGLAGIVLAGGSAADARTPLVLVALSLFYVAGMYLNDAFDREIDGRERPERPIPAGQVTAATVFGIGFGLFVPALAVLIWIGFATPEGTGWCSPGAGIALTAAIVFYDWHHKGNPLSPAFMGLCRMLAYLTAGLAVAAALPPPLLAAAFVAFCYLIGLTYVARQETLSRVANLWPLLFLAVPFLYGLTFAFGSETRLLIFAAFLGWVLYALSHLRRPGRANVPRAVVGLIAGISLLDAMLIAGHGEPVVALLAVGCFLLTLLLQRRIAGT